MSAVGSATSSRPNPSSGRCANHVSHMTASSDQPQSTIDGALAELGGRSPAGSPRRRPSRQLRDENAKILGKKGELTAILKQMGQRPRRARKAIGEKVNALKQEVERAFDEASRELARAKRDAELNARPVRPHAPRRAPPRPVGHKHPISIVREEIVAVFAGLGFAVHDGPEVELEENNFTKLGFPPDHPATDMQDSFWTTDGLAPSHAHEQHRRSAR